MENTFDLDMNDPVVLHALESNDELRLLMSRLRDYRVLKGISQDEVANYLGVTQPAVSKLERLTTSPHVSRVMGFANALGLRIRFVLEEL